MSLFRRTSFLHKTTLSNQHNSNKEILLFEKFSVHKGTPLCTFLSGSLTLEASVALPLFVMVLCAFLFFFRMLEIQQKVELAAEYAVRQTAVLAHGHEDWNALLEAEGLFYNELRKEDFPADYVQGSWGGFSFADSQDTVEYIDLCVSYRISNPISFFGRFGYSFCQRAKAHKWNGDMHSGTAQTQYVYVTDYGSVYHLTENCPFLDLSIQRVLASKVQEKRNKSGSRYQSCEECGEKHTEWVYITDYGTAYHSDLSCSGLRRSINRIPIEEAAGLGLCSRCARLQNGGD